MFTLLRNADVHAPHHRGVVDLLLVAGRVVWFGTGGSPLGAGLPVEEVDLEGAVVVPGLVDGHVHVTGGGGEGGPTTSIPQPALSTYTTAGVTTVVGLLGTDDVVRTPGQVHARVRALRELGLGAWMLTGGYGLPPATVTGDLVTDLVHVDAVVGVGEVAVSDHRGTAPTVDDLVALVTRVRTAALLGGKAGSVHLTSGTGRPVSIPCATPWLPATRHPATGTRRTSTVRDASSRTRSTSFAPLGCVSTSPRSRSTRRTTRPLLRGPH